jgi:hypothetical protein
MSVAKLNALNAAMPLCPAASMDDQTTTAPKTRSVDQGRTQNHFQGREPVRSHDQAALPSAPLSEEARRRRNALVW